MAKQCNIGMKRHSTVTKHSTITEKTADSNEYSTATKQCTDKKQHSTGCYETWYRTATKLHSN